MFVRHNERKTISFLVSLDEKLQVAERIAFIFNILIRFVISLSWLLLYIHRRSTNRRLFLYVFIFHVGGCARPWWSRQWQWRHVSRGARYIIQPVLNSSRHGTGGLEGQQRICANHERQVATVFEEKIFKKKGGKWRLIWRNRTIATRREFSRPASLAIYVLRHTSQCALAPAASPSILRASTPMAHHPCSTPGPQFSSTHPSSLGSSLAARRHFLPAANSPSPATTSHGSSPSTPRIYSAHERRNETLGNPTPSATRTDPTNRESSHSHPATKFSSLVLQFLKRKFSCYASLILKNIFVTLPEDQGLVDEYFNFTVDSQTFAKHCLRFG